MCRIVADRGSLVGLARRCVGCDPMEGAAACGAGMVCGFGEPSSAMLGVPIACLPEGADRVGDQCLTNDECASGLCNSDFICSTCVTDAGCSGGERCGPAWAAGPTVCSPGAGKRQPGEPCATQEDCASGTCGGEARFTCDDGRPCGAPPGVTCPFDDGLAPGECTRVGVTGGTCQ
jgi:hypothetical protein